MAWRDKLHIFRFWANKVLPQVYDDALSYYEVLNKMAAFLNECIEKINELIDEQEEYEEAMNQAWETFKEDMKDEWKAYKLLMEETWNEFKQYILDNLNTWEEETRQQVIDNINNELEIIIANLKDELELYIDGTRTVTVHVTKENNVITADKTYTEIRNIINEGGYVILNYNDHIYRYQYIGDDEYIEWFEEGGYYTQVGPHYIKINTINKYILQVYDDDTWNEIEDEYVVTPDIGLSNYGKFLKSTSGGLVWADVPSDAFLITFTRHSYASATPTEYTVDKTFDEVVTAITNGESVVAKFIDTFPVGGSDEGTHIYYLALASYPYSTSTRVLRFFNILQHAWYSDDTEISIRTININYFNDVENHFDINDLAAVSPATPLIIDIQPSDTALPVQYTYDDIITRVKNNPDLVIIRRIDASGQGSVIYPKIFRVNHIYPTYVDFISTEIDMVASPNVIKVTRVRVASNDSITIEELSK